RRYVYETGLAKAARRLGDVNHTVLVRCGRGRVYMGTYSALFGLGAPLFGYLSSTAFIQKEKNKTVYKMDIHLCGPRSALSPYSLSCQAIDRLFWIGHDSVFYR